MSTTPQETLSLKTSPSDSAIATFSTGRMFTPSRQILTARANSFWYYDAAAGKMLLRRRCESEPKKISFPKSPSYAKTAVSLSYIAPVTPPCTSRAFSSLGYFGQIPRASPPQTPSFDTSLISDISDESDTSISTPPIGSNNRSAFIGLGISGFPDDRCPGVGIMSFSDEISDTMLQELFDTFAHSPLIDKVEIANTTSETTSPKVKKITRRDLSASTVSSCMKKSKRRNVLPISPIWRN